MYAISTLVLMAAEGSREHNVAYFSSFVERLLKLSCMCESPLHGPLDPVRSNVAEVNSVGYVFFFEMDIDYAGSKV